MKGFLRELRARNVDRAALAYAGAGWLLAQGGQLLADAYQWPGWVIRALLAALMLGFPLVLVLAWFFEWTPAGLVADGASHPRPRSGCARGASSTSRSPCWSSPRSDTSRRPGSGGSPNPDPAPAAPVATATLAVLPFKPLLAATRDEALELGMTDTLIARLSSIEEVTVRPLCARCAATAGSSRMRSRPGASSRSVRCSTAASSASEIGCGSPCGC